MSFHFGLSNSSGAKHEFSRARLQNPKVYCWWFYSRAFSKPGAFQDCIADIFLHTTTNQQRQMCQVGLWCPQILMHFVFWAKSEELPLTIGLCHCNFSQKSENGTSSNMSSFAFNCQAAFSIRSTISQQVQISDGQAVSGPRNGSSNLVYPCLMIAHPLLLGVLTHDEREKKAKRRLS